MTKSQAALRYVQRPRRHGKERILQQLQCPEMDQPLPSLSPHPLEGGDNSTQAAVRPNLCLVHLVQCMQLATHGLFLWSPRAGQSGYFSYRRPIPDPYLTLIERLSTLPNLPEHTHPLPVSHSLSCAAGFSQQTLSSWGRNCKETHLYSHLGDGLGSKRLLPASASLGGGWGGPRVSSTS